MDLRLLEYLSPDLAPHLSRFTKGGNATANSVMIGTAKPPPGVYCRGLSAGIVDNISTKSTKGEGGMNIFKKLTTALAGLVAAGVFLSIVAPKAVSNGPATAVTVVNKVSQPVPVSVQQTPFEANGQCQFNDSFLCEIADLYSVPAGKIAVIESETGICTTDTGTQISQAGIVFNGVGGANAVSYVVPSPGVPISIGVETTFAQGLKGYAAGGSSGSQIGFDASASVSQTASSDGCRFDIAGYLVVP